MHAIILQAVQTNSDTDHNMRYDYQQTKAPRNWDTGLPFTKAITVGTLDIYDADGDDDIFHQYVTQNLHCVRRLALCLGQCPPWQA